MLKIVPMTNTPPGNPFHHDALRMGTKIGENVYIMFEKHQHERQGYVIVVNAETGERMRVVLDDTVRNLG
jgi:hypothetical protein